MTTTLFGLPADAVEFLSAQRALLYDREECECGRVRLHRVEDLHLGFVWVDPTNTTFYPKKDPFAGRKGHFRVPAVNLIATCEHFEPEYILCWLPDVRQFANADFEHGVVTIFPGATWSDIVANPVAFLNAQWEGGHKHLRPAGVYPFTEGVMPPFDQ